MSTATSRRTPGGATLIITATAIAGVAGYVATFLVFRVVGPASYAVFAIFWSALYLLVGGLSGVQQEITRATRVIEPGTRHRPSRARTFGLVLAAAVALLIAATSPLWANTVFPGNGVLLVLPLTVGVGSYVLVATLSGSLYGVAQWRALGLMIAVDGVIRVLFVALALLVTDDVVVLAWAVVLPLPMTIMVLWPSIRHRIVGRTDLDVGFRALTWNVARTVGASMSTAVLVSGFPLLLGVAASDVNRDFLGELIFTITLTRAPLIVTVMSLQSLLLVRFRDDAEGRNRMLLRVVGVIGVGAVVLGALGALLGPTVLSWLSAHPTRIDGGLIAVLVISSGIIASLTVTGAAVLATGRHLAYLVGWVAAAVVTVGALLLPLEFLDRVVGALLVGPAAGLLTHAIWLIARRIRLGR